MNKKSFVALFLLALLVFGCIQKNEPDMMKQMEDAEQYFSKAMSEKKVSAIYPNPIVLEKDAMAESWPSYYNKDASKEIQVKMTVSCGNSLEIAQSTGYFKIPPLEHKSFAVKLRQTDQTKPGTTICEVQFQKDTAIETTDYLVVEIK